MYEFLVFASNLVVGLTLFIAMLSLVAYPKVDIALKLLCIYFIVGASTEVLSFIDAANNEANTYLLHYYSFFECLVMIRIFGFLYHEVKMKLNLNIVLYPALLSIVLSSAFIQSTQSYNSLTGAIVSAIILALSIYYFFMILDKEKEIKFASIKKWSITFIFLYHVTLFIFTIFGNFLITLQSETALIIWAVRISIIFLVKVGLAYQIIRVFLTRKQEKAFT